MTVDEDILKSLSTWLNTLKVEDGVTYKMARSSKESSLDATTLAVDLRHMLGQSQ